MVAYRIQYEPFNRELIRLVRSGELGQVKLIDAINTQQQGSPDQWRMKKAMAGGGSLPDIGLYCLNTARAYTGEEPVEVFARLWSRPDDPRFREVEENVSFMLRFPSGAVANCFSGYDAHDGKPIRVHAEKAWVAIENAFAYRGQVMRIAIAPGRTPRSTSSNSLRKTSLRLSWTLCPVHRREPRAAYARRGRGPGSHDHGSDLRIRSDGRSRAAARLRQAGCHARSGAHKWIGRPS
jgi:predicted dehydrogenase